MILVVIEVILCKWLKSGERLKLNWRVLFLCLLCFVKCFWFGLLWCISRLIFCNVVVWCLIVLFEMLLCWNVSVVFDVNIVWWLCFGVRYESIVFKVDIIDVLRLRWGVVLWSVVMMMWCFGMELFVDNILLVCSLVGVVVCVNVMFFLW